MPPSLLSASSCHRHRQQRKRKFCRHPKETHTFRGSRSGQWQPYRSRCVLSRRYKDEELNSPKPISTQELLAGFGRMNVRDVPPHRFGTSGNFNTERTGDGRDSAMDGWGPQPQHKTEAARGWNTARNSEGARRGCFECGEDGHMVSMSWDAALMLMIGPGVPHAC